MTALEKEIYFLQNRKEIPEELISIEKLLSNYNMQDYLNVCTSRIADAGFIDMEHVLMGFDHVGNLVVDFIGLMKCEEILKGYISEEHFDEIAKDMKKRHHITSVENGLIKAIQNMPTKGLKWIIKDIGHTDDCGEQELIELYKAELQARKLHFKIIRMFNKIKLELFCMIKYSWVIRVVKRASREENSL